MFYESYKSILEIREQAPTQHGMAWPSAHVNINVYLLINVSPYNSATKIIFQQLNILPFQKTCISKTCFTNVQI